MLASAIVAGDWMHDNTYPSVELKLAEFALVVSGSERGLTVLLSAARSFSTALLADARLAPVRMHSVDVQISFASRGTFGAAINLKSPAIHSEDELMIAVESSQRMRCKPRRLMVLVWTRIFSIDWAVCLAVCIAASSCSGVISPSWTSLDSSCSSGIVLEAKTGTPDSIRISLILPFWVSLRRPVAFSRASSRTTLGNSLSANCPRTKSYQPRRPEGSAKRDTL